MIATISSTYVFMFILFAAFTLAFAGLFRSLNVWQRLLLLLAALALFWPGVLWAKALAIAMLIFLGISNKKQ